VTLGEKASDFESLNEQKRHFRFLDMREKATPSLPEHLPTSSLLFLFSGGKEPSSRALASILQLTFFRPTLMKSLSSTLIFFKKALLIETSPHAPFPGFSGHFFPLFVSIGGANRGKRKVMERACISQETALLFSHQHSLGRRILYFYLLPRHISTVPVHIDASSTTATTTVTSGQVITFRMKNLNAVKAFLYN